MTVTFTIDNPEIEKRLMEFVQQHKELTLEAFNTFVASFQKAESPSFPKKDPRKHMRFVHREYNPDEVDERALTHIRDSAAYVHDLRREKGSR